MNKFLKLGISLAIDGIGMLVSGPLKLGELLWAPASALMIWKLYHREFYMYLDFAEEILPGTELIPTATLAWMDENGWFKFLHPDSQARESAQKPNPKLARAYQAWKKST